MDSRSIKFFKFTVGSYYKREVGKPSSQYYWGYEIYEVVSPNRGRCITFYKGGRTEAGTYDLWHPEDQITTLPGMTSEKFEMLWNMAKQQAHGTYS